MIDPIKCLEYMQATAPKLAAAKANVVLLEEGLKSVKAVQMKKHGGLPVSAQEREALASEEYQIAINGLSAAVQEYETLRLMYNAATAKVDVWRSLESSNRAIDRGAR